MLLSNSSIFYFIKHLDNSITLECSVVMIPLHSEHTSGYTFILSLTRGTQTETAIEENVTSSREKAQRLFDHICTNNTSPEKLSELISSFRTIL